MTKKDYKTLSIREFTKAAKNYESKQAGIYRMCRKDYPDVLAELEKEPFNDLLDCGCGTAPMLTLLCKKAGLKMELFEKRAFCRLHCVARKAR